MIKRGIKKGFTLIEILVVITIMMALMAIIAGDASKMFSGNDINEAERVVLGAFSKARSRAVTLEQHVTVYVSYRSLDSQPTSKLWVVVGAGTDNDLADSPLASLDVDEMDFNSSKAVTRDDSVLPISYTLPESTFVHGVQQTAGGSIGRGTYTRWYAVFYPDGSCRMIRPDGEDSTHTPGSASWQNVNDYLPESYDYPGTGGTAAIDTDVSVYISGSSDPNKLIKTQYNDFTNNPETKHDLKLWNDHEERYYILQLGSGKLVGSQEN